MKIRKITLAAAMAGLFLTTSCEKDLLDQQDPNRPTVEQVFKTQDDAVKATNSSYAVLQLIGSYGRWLHFDYTLRSDEGWSNSPWTDLANSTRFIILGYNFDTVISPWTEAYRGVFRCNQVLARVPAIEMDAEMKQRLLGEARFLRALYYFDLVSLWGNVPLITEVSTASTRAPQGTVEQGWALVVADLEEAEKLLPATHTGENIGRATKGAAQALMGKAYMQQRKWAEASAQFAKVISSGTYALVPNYNDNFTETNENNRESIFEVQFTGSLRGGGQDTPGASEAWERPQFFGAPDIGWSDGQVRVSLFQEFTDKTVDGKVDPRRDLTIFNPTMLVYGRSYEQRNYNKDFYYWRKYQRDGLVPREDYFAGNNYRLIRYADVLLMQAEALNNQGQTAAAIPLINQVRARVNVVPLAGGQSQAQMKDQILHERLVELGGENTRFNDLARSGLFDTQAGVNLLTARDPDFANFVVGKSQFLPIPRTDVVIDSELKQNPGW